MPFSSQRQFLISVAGIDGYFMQKSGGNITSDSNKVYDGGQVVPQIVTSPKDVDNLTIGRAYDQARDEPILQKYRPLVGRWTTTVTVQPTDADLVAVGKPSVYSNAVLVSLTEPEYDASSGDVAMFEMEFAVTNVTN